MIVGIVGLYRHIDVGLRWCTGPIAVLQHCTVLPLLEVTCSVPSQGPGWGRTPITPAAPSILVHPVF